MSSSMLRGSVGSNSGFCVGASGADYRSVLTDAVLVGCFFICFVNSVVA